MIGWITNWAGGIIIAVIVATIIEMILPEGSSKKYIKVVIGVYILFTIISPVVSKFTGKTVAVSDIIDLNQYIDELKKKEKTQNLLQEDNTASIRDIYIGNLKSDIQNKLKGKGYTVKSIELDVGYDDNYTLNKITLSITKKEEQNYDEDEENNSTGNNTIVSAVNEVNISISSSNITNAQTSTNNEKSSKSNLSSSDKKKIKEYLSSVYEINEKNILINE